MADCRSDGELDCFLIFISPALSTMVAPPSTSTGTGKTSSDERFVLRDSCKALALAA
jgi:hypothetical protein